MPNNEMHIHTDNPEAYGFKPDGAGGLTQPESEKKRRQDEVEAFLSNPLLNPFGMSLLVGANAPGAQLDTTMADESRSRLGGLLEQLQQQAATGGGAWEQSFKDATQKAGATAQALGQSVPGVGGYQSQLRNIGNAQGAAAQQAVGQEEIIRARQKQAAQGQLSDALAGMGAQDVDQSIAAAGVRQGTRALNKALEDKSSQNASNTISGAGQGAVSLASLSDGGKVPGRAEVFGNDEQNDTVPAMLSPGEVVLPRTISHDPVAAADFVHSLNARKGVQHFAGGGAAPWKPGTDDPTSHGSTSIFGGPSKQAPSIENGGMLDTTQFNQSRAANMANDASFVEQAAGRGPSPVAQQLQNTTDSNIAAAMQAAANNKGAPGDVAMLGAQAQQNAAGTAGEAVAGETGKANAALTRSILAQRERDSTMARAQAEALFRNTQMNMGIGLDQQALLRNIIGGAGQAASGIAASGRANRIGEDDSYRPGRGSSADLTTDDPDFKAFGGEVGDDEKRRARDFVASLRGAA